MASDPAIGIINGVEMEPFRVALSGGRRCTLWLPVGFDERDIYWTQEYLALFRRVLESKPPAEPDPVLCEGGIQWAA